MQQDLLPLFPLQLVLFPGVTQPLHIFEDRYKEMIGEAIGANREFGIVLATDRGIVNMGCTAVVQKVVKQYPDGRMDILAVGRRRFEIVLLNEEKSYLQATVEFFDDDPDLTDTAELRQRALESYNKLRVLEDSELDEADPNDPQLSFQLAKALPDVNFRQMLLATRSEPERLRQIAEALPGYAAKQIETARVRELAPRNGHVRRIVIQE